MAGAIVERITGFVSPDPDAEVELAEARRRAASGDPCWREWLDDLSAGRALICRLEIEVTVSVGDGFERVRCEETGLWIELDPHPPLLECQAQEAMTLMLGALTRRHEDLPMDRLLSMCAHVEIDDAIRKLLPAP
jgi:hypothetical protein